MTWLEALILGIVQGLTEFLPVSSSGHLELGKSLLQIETQEDNLAFTVLVHGATVLSTIVVFRKDIWGIIINLLKFRWNDESKFVVKIFISMIPAMIIYIFFEDKIESLFGRSIIFVGLMLLFTSLVLFLTSISNNRKRPVNYSSSFIIGISQAIAMLPGISRSGLTIGTALLLGVDKNKATKFSFLMILIPIIGATVLKIRDLLDKPEIYSTQIMPLSIGFISAFVAGLLACSWMLNIVRRGKLNYFAIYCLIIGFVAIIIGSIK